MAQESTEPPGGEPDRQSPKTRWYCPTPDRFLISLLPITGLLWLSERFCWFAFNEHKNWTVLIAAAVVCAFVVFLLLWFGVSLVFRRRFQFGIRSLLVLVTVVAVMCSWFSVRMQQAERQREAVEAIEEGWGFVFYDYQLDADGKPLPGIRKPPLVLPGLNGQLRPPEPPGPLWLRNLVGVDFLSEVQALRYIAAHAPFVLGNQVTDAELLHLEDWTNLRELSLFGTEVTDAGLAHLKGLANLEVLDLAVTSLTDAGMVHLKGLTSLKHLDLNFTEVTDAGLMHLKGLANLEVLDLLGTQVSDAGVEDLQKALPKCAISW